MQKRLNKYLPTNFLKTFINYRNMIDISSYITMYKQFEIVKKIILNQNHSLNNENIQKKEEIITIDRKKGKK